MTDQEIGQVFLIAGVYVMLIVAGLCMIYGDKGDCRDEHEDVDNARG